MDIQETDLGARIAEFINSRPPGWSLADHGLQGFHGLNGDRPGRLSAPALFVDSTETQSPVPKGASRNLIVDWKLRA